MTQDKHQQTDSRIDTTTRRGALAALGGVGLLAALGGSAQADVGGGDDADELSHLLKRFYEGPESELPQPGVEGRRYMVTDEGGQYKQWTILRDDGASWDAINAGFGSVHTEVLNNADEPKDGSKLQSLFDNLSPGQAIRLRPNTTYTISEGLVIDQPQVTFVGPRSATIEFASGGSEDTFITIGPDTADRATIAGFSIDGTNQTDPEVSSVVNTNDGHGILINDENDNGAEECVIRDVRLNDIKNETITADGPSGDYELFTKVLDNIVIDPRFGGIHPHDDSTWMIRGNTIRAPNVTPEYEAIRHGHIIDNNRIEFWDHEPAILCNSAKYPSTVSHNILRESGGITDDSSNDTIEGNQLLDGPSNFRGIHLRDGSTAQDNRIEGYEDALVVRGSGNARLYDNTVVEPYRRALTIDAGGGAGGFELEGGAIIDPVTGGGWDAVNITGDDVTIKNVTFRMTGTGSPTWAIAGGSDASGARIIGCDVDNFDPSDGMFSLARTSLIREIEGHTEKETLSSSTPEIGWSMELVVLDASSNSVNAELPPPDEHPGSDIPVVAADVTNIAEVSPNDTENINGSNSSVSFSSAYDRMVFESDGADWFAVEASGAS